MRRSNIATDMDDPGSAIGLAEAALRQPDRLTPGLRAVALANTPTPPPCGTTATTVPARSTPPPPN